MLVCLVSWSLAGVLACLAQVAVGHVCLGYMRYQPGEPQHDDMIAAPVRMSVTIRHRTRQFCYRLRFPAQLAMRRCQQSLHVEKYLGRGDGALW